MRNFLWKIVFTLMVLSFFTSNCALSSDSKDVDTRTQETITISGAWALYPMVVRWAEEFHRIHPGVQFDISAGGAGKGMTDALAGAADIGMVSREIYAEEVEKGAFWVSVTRDAVFITVNENNPVMDELRTRGISQETLVGIYITGEITSWGQVVNRPEVQDPVHVYTRSDAAGAPATFAAYLNKKQEDLLGIGVYGDPGVLDAVIRDPLGIGYNNLSFAFDPSSGKPVSGAFVIPIDVNANDMVDPEERFESKEQAVRIVAEGHYPAPPARDLNLVTLGKPTGIVRDFIEWVLSDGQSYVSEVGYIDLNSEQLQNELAKLK